MNWDWYLESWKASDGPVEGRVEEKESLKMAESIVPGQRRAAIKSNSRNWRNSTVSLVLQTTSPTCH